jgi:hypothetical protein
MAATMNNAGEPMTLVECGTKSCHFVPLKVLEMHTIGCPKMPPLQNSTKK